MREFLILWLLRLLSWLPLRAAQLLGAGLGRLVLKFPDISPMRVSRTNIRLCFPDWPAARQEHLARASLIETAKSFAELGALWLWPRDKVLGLMRGVSGAECVELAYRRGQPVVLLTPHLGAWEMAGLYCSSRWPLTILYRPASRLPRTDALVRRARARCGGKPVATDSQGIRALHEALKSAEAVGILPDHEPTLLGKGVFAPFFGVPAFTAPLVPRLARKHGALVVFAYVERLPGGLGFHMHFLPAPQEVYDADTDAATAALNRGVEHCVRRCPEQYQWAYKRFKTRPPGEAGVY